METVKGSRISLFQWDGVPLLIPLAKQQKPVPGSGQWAPAFYKTQILGVDRDSLVSTETGAS